MFVITHHHNIQTHVYLLFTYQFLAGVFIAPSKETQLAYKSGKSTERADK
jgi:hypothetical protein